MLELLVDAQREVGDVVVDADREVPLGPRLRQLVEHRFHHRRGELLRGEPVATADDARCGGERCWRAVEFGIVHRFVDRRPDIEVEGFTHRAGFLRPVEHGHGSARRRKGAHERVDGERPVETNRDHPDPFTGGDERVDRLARRLRGGAHQHDDPFGVRRTPVLDDPVAAPRTVREPIHDLLHDPGHREMERVRRLAALEEHVRVLRRPADDGCVRRQPPSTELDDIALANHRSDVVVREQGDLRHLMARAEPVEEVHERNTRAQGRRVGDQGEVVGLLHARRAQLCPARRAGVHHVLVIAEDRQRMGRDRASSDMDHAGRQLAGDLEHVRHHQQEPLRRSERRRQRTLLQCAVERARRTRFGLHLDDIGDQTPQVRALGCRPVVAVLSHR